MGDEEACWHPVTKRKNNKSQSAQSGGHVRKKTRRLHKMMCCVSWLRFGPNVVLRQEAQNWRKDGAVEETTWGLFRAENETRRPLQWRELCCVGFQHSRVQVSLGCGGVGAFLLLSLDLLNTLPGCSGEHSDMLKELDLNMQQVKQMYEH